MRMTLLLGGAVALAAALAGIVRPRTPAAAEPEALPALAAASQGSLAPAAPASANDAAAVAIQGEVLEALPASNYTYLRLQTPQGEVWAAVPAAQVALHSEVSIANATRMVGFNSPTLKRTFPVIYFGTLGDAAAAPAAGATVNDSDALPPGHPDLADDGPGPFGAPAHGPSAAVNESALAAPPSERASGPSGHSLAELAMQQGALVGKKLRVRAQVTKVTDLKGQAFFHVRDTSLGPDGHAVDLVVTSDTTPQRGDVATFEGTLRTEVDVGIGYKYPLLLENATIQR
jgi:hypothetical protein